MEHTLPALPYAIDALAPHYSRETLEYHHGKHHNAYVVNLNNLQKGTEFEAMVLEDIVRKSSGGIYNNAAQVWNHTFFWHCMKPAGGGEPGGALAAAINAKWGSYAAFKEAFVKSAVQPGHRQHWRRRHAADHRRQGAAHGGRVGARLLHRLSQPAAEVGGDLPRQARQLGLRAGQFRLKGMAAAGRGACGPQGPNGPPRSRCPGLMPRLANQPWFISSA